MTAKNRHHIIIVGCGRLGAELARNLSQTKHSVVVIDANERAFDRLGTEFRGRTVLGEAVDQDVLYRAGIQEAHAFAAVTSSDSVNVVTSRVARDLFNVEHVFARLFNPRKAVIYEKLGLQTVATSSWGAERFEQLILHPGVRSFATAGNGEIQFYEMKVPQEWSGRRLVELVPAEQAIVIALTRAGRATLPAHDTTLQEDDILHVSATSDGVAGLRTRLKTNGGKHS